MSGNESEFESLLSNSLVSASERLGSCWLFYLTEISAKHGAPCRPQGAGSDPRPRTVSVSEGRNAFWTEILRWKKMGLYYGKSNHKIKERNFPHYYNTYSCNYNRKIH